MRQGGTARMAAILGANVNRQYLKSGIVIGVASQTVSIQNGQHGSALTEDTQMEWVAAE